VTASSRLRSRPRRSIAWSRLLTCGATWLTAVAGSLWIAAETSVGPVVVELSANHGVHAGDLIVAGAMGLVATVVSVVLLRRR
jgi:hypothetical protein